MSEALEPDRTSWVAVIGIVFHALLAFPFLLAGLFAPLWTALAMWTVWTAILVLALAVRRRRPLLVAILPVITVASWLVALSIAAA